jgi:hypothetical protein
MKQNFNFKRQFKRTLKTNFFLFLFICASLNSKSQIAFDWNDSIRVKINGNYLQNPWAGGTNYGQFSALDLNLDGTKDLVIFDRTGNKIMPFINLGTPNQVAYKYAPQYIPKFPALHDWALFTDYNCDGREDIFSYSSGGFSVFKNTSSPLNGLSFELEIYILKSRYSAAPSDYLGLYISRVDIPAFADIDYDGDIDVLTFDINSGTEIQFHRNKSMELYGVCDSLNEFRLEGNCWGQITANSTNTVILNTACRPVTGPQGYDTTQSKILHVGSTELALDIDNDHDYDLLLGGVSTNDLNLLSNGGDSVNAHITAQENFYPQSNIPVDITIFPAAYHLDVNNDGHKDLIASPNAGNSSENFNSNWYYQNMDTTGACNFMRQSTSFLQEQMIETGEGAYPTFFDYNSDGLKDLVIGNYGYFNVGSALSTRLALFKNIGSSLLPEFELITRDYANLGALNLSNVTASFGDVDGDGDNDMMVGTNSNAGSILYFENLAGVGNTANFVLSNATLLTGIGTYPMPQLVDVDRDSKKDLIIGLRNGTLAYSKNNSTSSSSVVFATLVNSFGNVNVCSYGSFVGYCAPQMIDEGGVYHLYAGNQDGHIYHYDNIDGNLNGSFTLKDSAYRAISGGDRVSPAIADINADGYMDVVLGNYSGGVGFYKGKYATVGIQKEKAEQGKLIVYPNPASAVVNFKIMNVLPESTKQIEVYNNLGQVQFSKKINVNSISIPTQSWNKGIYTCKLTSEEGIQIQKFVIE